MPNGETRAFLEDGDEVILRARATTRGCGQHRVRGVQGARPAGRGSIEMSKAFASQGDLAEKRETFDELAPGVFALTAEGDPNSGVVVGDDSVLVIDARATPVMAKELVAHIRKVTDKPIRHVLLTHYHAVRVLGVGRLRGAGQRHRQRRHPRHDRGARRSRTWSPRSSASRACSGPRRPSPA